HVAKGFGEQAVAEFSNMTGVDYVVAWNKDPFKIEPIFRNPSFSVYRIRVTDGKPEETAP
ncbi:MAG: hypothetical protein NT069_08380, partial [Planctomycetota bacterium]|nr:hypothetical protein [Planctomycetota bacterium]